MIKRIKEMYKWLDDNSDPMLSYSHPGLLVGVLTMNCTHVADEEEIEERPFGDSFFSPSS